MFSSLNLLYFTSPFHLLDDFKLSPSKIERIHMILERKKALCFNTKLDFLKMQIEFLFHHLLNSQAFEASASASMPRVYFISTPLVVKFTLKI